MRSYKGFVSENCRIMYTCTLYVYLYSYGTGKKCSDTGRYFAGKRT